MILINILLIAFLLPFVIVYLFFKLIKTTAAAFLSGLGGHAACPECGKLVHYRDALYGCCSEQCALANRGEYNEQEVEEWLRELLSDPPPEWTTLTEQKEPVRLDVGIDEGGWLHMIDYTVEDDPQWKVIGHDGYAIQTR